jgi:hypothetical protein
MHVFKRSGERDGGGDWLNKKEKKRKRGGWLLAPVAFAPVFRWSSWCSGISFSLQC